MDKGTIIYVGNFELPDKNAAAHRVVNNAKIFSALGFRAALLGTVRGESFSGYKRTPESPVASRQSPEGGDFPDIDLWERAYPASTADWIRQLFDVTDVRAAAEAYDDLRLVIAYNLPFATLKSLKKEFEKTGVHVAYDCTEWNGYATGSLAKRLYKKRDEKLIRTRLGRICCDLIVISSAMEKQYAGANLLRLPPLVDIEDGIWRQERDTRSAEFEFCFSGTVSNKERLDRVIEAFRTLDAPEARLRVIGLTEEEYASAYPDKAEDALSDRRVSFDGYLPHADAVRRTLSCGCCVFIREATGRNTAGFPTKFVEAYTCGVPIITTDVSDVAPYIDSPDKGELLRDASADGIRKAMTRAIENYCGRRPALNGTFDWRNYVDRTREWINRVLD